MGNVSSAMKKAKAEKAPRYVVSAAAPPPAVLPAEPEVAKAAAAAASAMTAAATAARTAPAARPAVQPERAAHVSSAGAASPTVVDEPAAKEFLAGQPGNGKNGYAPVLVVHHRREDKITEQYRALRAHLLANCPNGRLCMMVTSAESGEGKTVTCLNLALVLAGRPETRAVVVDCDFRKHRVASLLRATTSPGLADVLRGRAALGQVVRGTVYPNLYFISSGMLRGESPGELLHQPEMEDVVSELRRHYDYVLFDTPPLMAVSDVTALGRVVSDALMVVRLRKTSREAVQRSLKVLEQTRIKVIGMVLTHQHARVPGYIQRNC